jgi:hypothetical protein
MACSWRMSGGRISGSGVQTRVGVRELMICKRPVRISLVPASTLVLIACAAGGFSWVNKIDRILLPPARVVLQITATSELLKRQAEYHFSSRDPR